MSNENKASFWSTVRDVAHIDENITFASEMLDKYSWKKEEQIQLTQQMERIRTKQKDDCLNLSVIGEFSCGKSSFINALLNIDLLTSSVIQGTTVTNTIIYYSPQPVITISFRDGRHQSLEPESMDELRQQVSVITTDGDAAQHIAMVSVGLPSPLLEQNIRIIDTPGTNSLATWHEDVTRQALSDLSDLAIILTDSTKPLPMTLMDFIEENVHGLLSQCAVAATRFDLVPQGERDSIMTYISKKMCHDFDLPSFLVLPFSPLAVIGQLQGQKLVEEQEKMAKLTEENAQKLLSYMAERRQIAQMHKLLDLTDKMFTALQSNINGKLEECQKELELLQRSLTANLKDFIEEQKRKIGGKMDMECEVMRSGIRTVCEAEVHLAKKRMEKLLLDNRATTATAIKEYVNGQYIKNCEKEAKSIHDCLHIYDKQLPKLFKKYMKQFQEAFQKEFEKLQILKVDFKGTNVDTTDKTKMTISDLGSSFHFLNEEENHENWCFGGGAAGGAGLGLLIGGPVGAVVGGIIGFLVGGFNTHDAADIKRNVLSKLSTPLNNFCKQVQDDTVDTLDKWTMDTCQALRDEMDRYLKAYRDTVNNKIRYNKEKQKKLQAEIDVINQDLALLTAHQQQLQTALKQMK